MRVRFVKILSVVTACSFVGSPVALGNDENEKNEKDDAPIHIHLARDAKPARPGGSSPLMTFHGGTIMTDSNVTSIFWGPSWANASFAGDKLTGLDAFYQGFDASKYAKTSDEYTGTNGQVGRSLAFAGHLIDLSSASNGRKTSPILAEVCKMIPNPVTDGFYPVYTDVPRGHAGFCAWHSWGTCNGVSVQIAFFFDLDGDPGCDPQSGVTAESQGLAALANVSAHELSEARTDPQGAGWFDSKGAENGDKCVWTFNVPYVTFPNGTQWKLQGEWSNAAYTAGTGYPNSSGQKGCLDGH